MTLTQARDCRAGGSCARAAAAARALCCSPAATGCRAREWFPKCSSCGEHADAAARSAWSRRASRWRRSSRRPICRRHFRSNGTLDAGQRRTTRRWRQRLRRLAAGGRRPGRDSRRRFSLAELRALPSRTQITRHDCVEGWSAIGKWKGVPLGACSTPCGRSRSARYVVFHCADPMERGRHDLYYESIDLDDAHHPQTILAYELNDKPLPVAERRAAAPARRAPARLQAWRSTSCASSWSTASRTSRGGKGGYWEDQGYEWYAGI